MSLTGFFTIPDIAGESQRAHHEGEIEFHGIDWSVEQAQPTNLTGRGRKGRAQSSPLTIYKWYDASSPYIALASLNGKHFDEIKLTVENSTAQSHFDYLTIELQNCAIAGYRMVNDDPVSTEARIRETVAISFERINIIYTVQADDGSDGDEHEIEFDIAAGV